MAALSMPLLLGSVGLATDTIQWALWKRQLQRAADSAAFAGAYARFQEKSSTDAATHDLGTNNHLWVPLMGGFPQISEPADTSTFVRAVEVRLQVQQALTFSSIFMDAAPIITATARAAAIDSGLYCVVALENTNNSGIIIQGSSIVNLGCGMISNSPAASVSVGVNGNAHNVTAVPVAGAGGVPDINGVSAANELSNQIPMLDPYEDLYNTDPPAGMSCTDMDSHEAATSAADVTLGFTKTLNPGCYTGNNQFKFTGGKIRLKPGTYYLSNTDFDMQGGTIVGDGVTIILTGTTPKQLKLNGGATIQLTAPTSGTFKNMVLMQSPNAVWSNNANIINGSATSKFDGAFYFPKQQITFSGNAGAITKCAMVVARRVEFAGNANLQNDTTGCVAPTKVKGKIIKLIA